MIEIVEEFIGEVLGIVSNEHQIPTNLSWNAKLRVLNVNVDMLPQAGQYSDMQPEFGCEAHDSEV